MDPDMTSGEKDSVDISIQKDGISLGAKGGAAIRLGHVVADLASPFSEGLGALGDVIHYYRRDMAIRSLQKSRELAEILGVEIKPVPPKFLVDWIEKASLEAPEDVQLTNMWAGLLLTAGNTKSSTVYHFKRILGELTLRHVEFLSVLCRQDFNKLDPYIPETDFSKWIALRDVEVETLLKIEDLDESVEEILAGCENNRFAIQGYYLISTKKFGLDRVVSNQKTKTVFDEFQRDFVIKYFLDSGIVQNVGIDVPVAMDSLDSKLSHYLHADALYLTDFGLEFISSCRPQTSEVGEKV